MELIFFPKEKAGSNKHENEYIGPILQALNEITALDISFYLPDTAKYQEKTVVVSQFELPFQNRMCNYMTRRWRFPCFFHFFCR